MATVTVLGKAHHALAQFQGGIQGKVISFSDVPRMIKSLLKKLEEVRDIVHEAVEESKVLFDTEITQKIGKELQGVEQQQHVEKHLTTYMNHLIQNIQEDFEESQHLVAALSLFDPNTVLLADPTMDRGKLDNLLDYYGKELTYKPDEMTTEISIPAPVMLTKHTIHCHSSWTATDTRLNNWMMTTSLRRLK